MNTQIWLKQAQIHLQEAGVSTARLDCLVLLEDATGKDRAWLLAHPEFELPEALTTILDARVYRRAQHVPLAYIRGKAEFYGREFLVNEHTLVPRPETEAMIELLMRVRNLEADMMVWEMERRGRKPAKHQYPFEKQQSASKLIKTDEGYKVTWEKPQRKRLSAKPTPVHGSSLRYHDENLYIVDIGTGSGAIAITAKLELPEATVRATDIDEKCLGTAQKNAEKLGADVELLHGNLLEPVRFDHSKVTVLLCNLPYVPDNFQINTAATHEPRHALFGGPDGLGLYREMFAQINTLEHKPEYVLAESLPPQHESLTSVAETAGYRLNQTNDFIQLFTLG